mmetsp:Transcript_152520/g.489131  ORF Transcript_152520/g.489131 Transcript_152520/m.489131 type:complete len:101 (-) Transcript_152520:131-433(-)
MRIPLIVGALVGLCVGAGVVIYFYPHRIRWFFFGKDTTPPPSSELTADVPVVMGVSGLGLQGCAPVVLGRPVRTSGGGPQATFDPAGARRGWNGSPDPVI